MTGTRALGTYVNNAGTHQAGNLHAEYAKSLSVMRTIYEVFR